MSQSKEKEKPTELQQDLMDLCIKHGLCVVFLGRVTDKGMSFGVDCSVVGYLPIPEERRNEISNNLIDHMVRVLKEEGFIQPGNTENN